MYAEERQQAIATLVAQRGRMSVQRAGRAVRRHHRDRPARPLHAGADAAAPPRPRRRRRPAALTLLESALRERDQAAPEAEGADRSAAVDLLPAGRRHDPARRRDDDRTARQPAPAGPALHGVHPRGPVASALAGIRNIELHLLPGRVRRTTHAAVGAETVAAIARLRVDVAFLGTNGADRRHGCSTPDHAEAATKAAMVASANRTSSWPTTPSSARSPPSASRPSTRSTPSSPTRAHRLRHAPS